MDALCFGVLGGIFTLLCFILFHLSKIESDLSNIERKLR